MIRFSLKNKLTFSILLTMLMFGLLNLFFTYSIATDTLFNFRTEQIEAYSHTKSTDIASTIENFRFAAKTIAESSIIEEYIKEKPNLQDPDILEFLKFYNIEELYSAVYIMNSDGLTLVSTDETFVGQNYSFRDYFQKAIDGTPYFEPALGVTSKQLGFYVSYPITIDGKNYGVAVIKLRPFTVLNSVYNDFSNINDIMLIDENGIVLYSTKPNRIFSSIGKLTEEEIVTIRKKRYDTEINTLAYHVVSSDLDSITDSKTFFLYDELDKTEEIINVSKIKNTSLFLITEFHEKTILNQVLNLVTTISIARFVGISIVIFLIYIFITFTLKPMESIYFEARRIADGDYNAKIKITNTMDKELAKLAEAINKMLLKNKSLHEDTEIKIQTQTKKLIEKTQYLKKQQAAIINILEDVEEEKNKNEKLASELEKFKLAADNASDIVIITDRNGVLLYVNNSIKKIIGQTREIALSYKNKGSWLKKLLGNKKYEDIWTLIKGGKKSFTGEVDIKDDSEETKTLLLSMSPVLDKEDHVTFFVGIAKDITKEKEIDKAKTELISLASHQLRTPLSTINWYTELLLSGDAGRLNNEQGGYLNEIQKDSRHMSHLINALLNASRLELGTLTITPEDVDIAKLSDNIIKELRYRIDKKKQHFIKKYDSDLPKKMNLDKQLTYMIIENLLSNAVKYTKPKGKIHFYIKKKGKHIEIVVKDSGIGIPKKQQNRIFTKLFRAENAKEAQIQGTGLGLYVVKSVLDRIGGKIWFKSHIDKGTTFFVKIPIIGMPTIKRKIG